MKRVIPRKLITSGFLLLAILLLFGRVTPAVFSSSASPRLVSPTRAISSPIRVSLHFPAPALHVSRNLLLNSAGQPVRLIGANRSGTEYSCLSYGIFDGPSNQASITAMLSWHINAIRIPLNEDCWLNVNLGDSPFGGAVYQQAIQQYVQLLIVNGITPILDLHWTAPGSEQATGQAPMPDRDHSPSFWSQVASAFKGNNAVIFDLFNEPFPDNDGDTTSAWNCWRNGTNASTCPFGTAGLSYNAAGMQELVTAVRATGATNVIMLGGIQYSSTLDRWMQFAPSDPAHELAVSWHLYNFSHCNLPSCWNTEGPPVMQFYPVISGEIGENGQGGQFIVNLMAFLDHPGSNLPPQSYLAWTWNTDQTVFDLITSYNGAPSVPYGVEFQQHVMAEFKR